MQSDEHIKWGLQYWKAVDKVQNQPSITHAIIGIGSEAGELLDFLKKYKFHTGEYDRETIIDELGDLLFYISRLLFAVGGTYEEAFEANKVKLDYRMKFGKDKDKERVLQRDVFKKYRVDNN